MANERTSSLYIIGRERERESENDKVSDKRFICLVSLTLFVLFF